MDKASATLTRSHKIVLAVIVALFALVVFGAAELLLRAVGYGDPKTRADPLFGFRGSPSAFIVSELPSHGLSYIPSAHRGDMHAEQHFGMEKSRGTFRVFVFGGSTTQGAYFGLDNSFPKALERILRARYPERTIEVINWGISGYGSTRVSYLVEEGMQYEPDLIVVYTGQNEFRDGQFHAKEIRRSDFTAGALSAMMSSHVGYGIHRGFSVLLAQLIGPRVTSYGGQRVLKIVSEPFSARSFSSWNYFRVPQLTREAGVAEKSKSSLLGSFRKGLRRMLYGGKLSDEEVYSNFAASIRRTIEAAQANDVDILFLAKARNTQEISAISDYKVPRFLVSEDQVDNWSVAYELGVASMQSGEYESAIAAFNQVLEIYGPEYKGEDTLLHLYLGAAYELVGRPDSAVVELLRRLGHEHFEINRLLKEVTAAYSVPVIDVMELFSSNSESGIVGYDSLFVDGVHFKPAASHIVAMSIADRLQLDGVLPVAESDAGEQFRDPLEDSPQSWSPASLTGMAWSEFNRGHTRQALEFAELAVSMKPDLALAQILLGYLYAASDRAEDAQQQWQILNGIWRGD